MSIIYQVHDLQKGALLPRSWNIIALILWMEGKKKKRVKSSEGLKETNEGGRKKKKGDKRKGVRQKERSIPGMLSR